MSVLRFRPVMVGLLLLPLASPAQEPLRPVLREELWLSAGITGRAPWFLKKMIGKRYKRIRLGAEAGYRSADNFFAGRQTYLEGSGRYRISPSLAAGIEYRWAYRGSLPNRQRLCIDVDADRTVGRTRLAYRIQPQWTFRERNFVEVLLRNRFSMAYDIRKWKADPRLDLEFFTHVNDPRGWNHIGTRWKLSTDLSPWKGHTFSPALLFDQAARVAWPVNRFIWSLSYTLDLRGLW